MKVVTNERGYALVVALLTITVFVLLFIMLVSATLNNAKQIDGSENQIQATSLAEMGVVHYNAAIVDALWETFSLDETMEEIETKFNQLMLEKYEEVTEENQDEINKELRLIIAQTWQTNTATPQLVHNPWYVENDKQYAYQIQSNQVEVTYDERGITYQFVSNGITPKNTVGLEAQTHIPIEAFVTITEPSQGGGNDGGGEGNDGGNDGEEPEVWIPEGNSIQDPESTGNLDLCTNNNDFSGQVCEYNGQTLDGQNVDLRDAVVKVNGSLNYNGSANGTNDNTTLYVTGSLTTQSYNNHNHFSLHVNNDANFNGTFNNLSNSTIEIGGSAVYSGTFQNIENSKIYIGHNANFNGTTSLDMESILYIGGDGMFSDHLSVDGHSKVCVNGNLTINKHLQSDGTGEVYVKGNVQVQHSDLEIKQVSTEAELIAACTAGTPSEPPSFDLEPTWSPELFQPSTNYNYIYTSN